MSNIDCTGRFCPTCQTNTERSSVGACKPCKARRTAKYRAANPEKVKAGIDAWRLKNKAAANASSTAWAIKNRARSCATSAAWKKANREYVRADVQNRRAMVLAASGRHSAKDISEIMALQRFKCANCAKSLKKEYHIDHRMPLSRGGSNDRSNIDLLCPKCNLAKSSKLPHVFAQENGRLL